MSPRDGVRGRAADDADGRPCCRAAYRGGVSSCTFCAIAAGHKTDQPVVAADELPWPSSTHARPVFKGHVLVIPRMHYRTLADLPPELTRQGNLQRDKLLSRSRRSDLRDCRPDSTRALMASGGCLRLCMAACLSRGVMS